MTAGILFLLALLIRLAVIALARFDGLYGQDAYAYLDYVRQILARRLSGPFYWPLGYPATAGLFTAIMRDPVLGAQTASLVLGAALAPLTYALVREISPRKSAGRGAAVAAGLMLAVAGQAIQSSIVIMADVPGLFWATLSAYALIRSRRALDGQRREAGWLVLSAAALALAAVTRWLFLILFLVWIAYWSKAILRWSKTTFRWRQVTPEARRFRRATLWAALAALVVLAPQAAITARFSAPFLGHAWLLGWSPRNALHTSFENVDGRFDYAAPPAAFYLAPWFHPFYLTPLLAPFALAGAWRLRRSDELILLGGWAALPYLFLAGIPYENFRFGLAYFPPIAALAAMGLFGGHSSAPNRAALCLPRGLPALALALSLAASTPAIVGGLSEFLAIKSRELAALEYLRAQLPPGATVLTFGLTLTLEHYGDFAAVELYRQTPATLAATVCADEPVYLYIQLDNVESQWAGRAPEVNYRWLRDRAGLSELGGQGGWRLYAVGAGDCPKASGRWADS